MNGSEGGKDAFNAIDFGFKGGNAMLGLSRVENTFSTLGAAKDVKSISAAISKASIKKIKTSTK